MIDVSSGKKPLGAREGLALRSDTNKDGPVR